MKRQDYIVVGIMVMLMIGFYFLRPDFKVFPFLLGFLFSYGFLRLFSQHKKHRLQSDEMTKKAGYSALAFSFQILMLIGLILGAVDVFIPFLQNYSAGDAIVMMIVIGGLSVGFSSRYYSHNPDKTGL